MLADEKEWDVARLEIRDEEDVWAAFCRVLRERSEARGAAHRMLQERDFAFGKWGISWDDASLFNEFPWLAEMAGYIKVDGDWTVKSIYERRMKRKEDG